MYRGLLDAAAEVFDDEAAEKEVEDETRCPDTDYDCEYAAWKTEAKSMGTLREVFNGELFKQGTEGTPVALSEVFPDGDADDASLIRMFQVNVYNNLYPNHETHLNSSAGNRTRRRGNQITT